LERDIHCERCGGSGFIYTYQKDITVTQTVGVNDTSGIIEVSKEYEEAHLEMVCDHEGKNYNAEKTGVFISLSNPPRKGIYLFVVMSMDIVKKLDTADCESAGGGYYRISGLQSRRAGIDGIYYSAPGDVVKIGTITDTTGKEYQARELRLDMFYIETPDELVEPVIVKDVSYIPPFIFALSSQEISKADAEAMVQVQGEAVLTFPYNLNVGEGDILTAFAGSYPQKDIMTRVEGADDTIGAYFVMDISSCIGKKRDYIKGKDYILAGTNRIKWLCDDAPLYGEAYSISYSIYPTYRVVKSIPQIRTSENQRLPKKAIVKLFSTYAENKRINQQ
jgi:hypothetical protein